MESEDQQRLTRLENQMLRATDDFGALKLLVEKNNTNLEEFIDLAKALKIGLKVLGFIEKTAVFITKVALAAGTVYAVWKFAINETIQDINNNRPK